MHATELLHCLMFPLEKRDVQTKAKREKEKVICNARSGAEGSAPVLKMLVAEVCSYGGMLLLVLFGMTSAMAGMMWLADAAEERTLLAKRVLVYTAVVVLMLHVFLLLFESLPLLPVLLGSAAHIAYLSLASASSFPIVHVSEPVPIVCIALFVMSLLSYTHMVSVELIDVPTMFGVGFLVLMAIAVPFGVLVLALGNDTLLPGGISSSSKGGVQVKSRQTNGFRG